MITHINPVGSMDLLSQLEVDRLQADRLQRYLSTVSQLLAGGPQLRQPYRQFQRDTGTFQILRYSRDPARARVKLELFNAPEHAFVDGEIIRGIQEHLFSVLRDILYVSTQLESNRLVNLTSSTHISNVVFAILRNAKAILPGADPNLVVCWGGHSINEVEYQYTRQWVASWVCASSTSAPAAVRVPWRAP